MTYAWRIAWAILAVASIACSNSSATPHTTTLNKGRIYNKTIELMLAGDEYRNNPDYPKDNVGKGFNANAKANYVSKCAALKNRLEKDLRSMLLSFRCSKGRNIAVQSTRRQYQGVVTIKINHDHILFEKGDKVESPLVKANDFSSENFKWQDSREEARKAYKKACDDYTYKSIQNDPDQILLVDCGIINNVSSKVGWRYFSIATIYKISYEPDPRACGKNKYHNDFWWMTDVGNPIRSDVACQFGGRKEQLYKRVIAIQCQDGQEIATGAEKKGSFIRSVGSCYLPANCGSYSHGSTWWEQDAHTRESAHCRHGGDKVDVYERLRKYSCYNGSTSTTSNTKKGSHIRSEGHCNKRPREKRDCSNHPHGDTWQDRNVIDQDTKSCGRGGTKIVTKAETIRYRCNDGKTVEESRDTKTNETKCRGQRRDEDDDHAKRERDRREREKVERDHRQKRDREKAEHERQQRDRQAERERRDREKAERERQQRDRQAERERREREKAEQDRQQRDREKAEREQEAERERKKAEREHSR